MKTKIDTVECIVCGQTVPTTEAVCDEKIMDYVCLSCAHEAVENFAITPDEAAMLIRVAEDECNAANGAGCLSAHDTYTWLDGIATTKAEGALLTNLAKKELIHIWNYDTDRREHTIQLSDFGFRLYQYLKGGTNETHRHAN